MGRNLLARMGVKELAELQMAVELDKSQAYGIKWKQCKGKRSKSIGKTFWIKYNSYQSAQVVLLLSGRWPADDKLVATRIDCNLGWNDPNNLQWSQHGDARRSNSERARLALINKTLGNDGPDLGPLLRLAKVCGKNHRWKDCDLGLQRKWGDSWRCDECARLHDQSKDSEKQKQWYQSNIEEQRRKARERMAARRTDPAAVEIMRERTRKCAAKRRAKLGRESRAKGISGLVLPPGYALDQQRARICRQLLAKDSSHNIETLIPLIEQRLECETILKEALKSAGKAPSVARLVMDEQRRYWQENPEAKHEHRKQWAQQSWWLQYQINPELRLYTRQKSKRRKAVMRNSVAIQLTGAQVRQRFEQFGHACAYCGATGDLHIEHVIPISKGGTHALGNVVPACADCNYSKHVGEVEAWYRAQPFFTEQRWRKICRVLSWDRGSVGQLALL